MVSSKTTKAPAGQADALQGVQGYLVQIGDAKGSILDGRPMSGTRIVAMSLRSRTEETIHTLQRGPKTRAQHPFSKKIAKTEQIKIAKNIANKYRKPNKNENCKKITKNSKNILKK